MENPELEMADPDEGSNDEQRRFRRHGVSLAVNVWLADADNCDEQVNKIILSQPRTAFVDDLSVSGLRFVAPVAFPVHSVVGVRLRLGGRTFQLEGLVRWRDTQWVSGKRCYEYGLQFSRTQDTPEAVLCIAKYVTGARLASPPGAFADKSGPPYLPLSTSAQTPKKYPWEP